MKCFRVFFLALSLLFLTGNQLFSATCTAIANGDWTSAGSWSCGRAPADGDVIEIPAGFVISVTTNTSTYSGMIVNVDGELNFGNGSKLNLAADGQVNVSNTGSLTGGNPGSKINIGGTTVWNGPGPDNGPLVFGSGPLPIQISSFTAEVFQGNKVQVKWTTASETNNDYFTVERSSNGLDFYQVAKVEGSGTTSSQKTYSTVDDQPEEGNIYYRLKQTDVDGKYEYSGLIALYFEKKAGNGCVLKVYPNPCTPQCSVDLAECRENPDAEIRVEILDAAGNRVYSNVPSRDHDGNFSFSIDPSNNLKPGVYIVRGASVKENYSERVVIK